MGYRHTQTGYATLIALGLALVPALWWAVATPDLASIGTVLGLFAAIVLFSSLTVVVRDRVVDVFFGPGVIWRRIPLDRIRDARPVRTPWYYGWGIHLTPDGWLWNVSGLDGVELLLDDGRRFRIGSDEPAVLARALDHRQNAG